MAQTLRAGFLAGQGRLLLASAWGSPTEAPDAALMAQAGPVEPAPAHTARSVRRVHALDTQALHGRLAWAEPYI